MLEMWIVWLLLFIGFVALEFATVALLSLWFAAGSLVAMIMALLGFSIQAQIIAMVLVSGVLLAVFWAFRKKWHIVPPEKQATNADRLIGQVGEVIQMIDPVENTGQVQVNGQIWSARTDGAVTIPVGTMVHIVQLRGVKLVVEPA